MFSENEKLLLSKEDYQLLTAYLNGANGKTSFDYKNAVALKAELKKASLVEKSVLPDDVIRINSRVEVKTEETNQVMQFVLVTPEKANIKGGRVSVMSPIGTALIGYKKGQQVSWQVPSGKKTYTILDVVNGE